MRHPNKSHNTDKTNPDSRLNRLPELKFKYVEEEEPEEFFIPYVWTLATQVGVLVVLVLVIGSFLIFEPM